MNWSLTALPGTVVAVDVAGYGSTTRTDRNRLAVRDGLYRILTTAFDESGIPLERGVLRDSGDGVVIVLPPSIPKIELVDRLPHRIAVGLRRHNDDHSAGAGVRLRVALHAGEIRADPNGFVGETMNFTFRILDAADAKRALAGSRAELVLVLSDWFYRSVVMNDPAAEPGKFQEVVVSVKETRTTAWIRLLGGQAANSQENAVARPPEKVENQDTKLATLNKVVNLLSRTPGFTAREDRDLVLEHLDTGVTTMIKRHAATRLDITSIVLTCWHYEGAWQNLLDALRMYADGSEAMTALDRLDVRFGPARTEE